MARRAHITIEAGWFRHEVKTIEIAVDDGADPVNLTGLTLEWAVRRARGSSTAYLTKATGSGITVTGVGSEIATIAIATTDYASLVAGVHYHELWDRSNDLLLAYGDVHLQDATAEEA